jgi:starch phosphorylase
LADVIAALDSGLLSPDDPGRYRPIVDELKGADGFMVAADFTSYRDKQAKIDDVFRDRTDWTTRSILNIARSGWFSSDRTIQGYARDIWGLGDIGRR